MRPKPKKFVIKGEMDSDEEPIENVLGTDQDSRPFCFASRVGNVSPYLFYPEDPIKSYWDIFIMIVLIFACLVQPCRLAFVETETPKWTRIY
jgi:hypothetical protein